MSRGLSSPGGVTSCFRPLRLNGWAFAPLRRKPRHRISVDGGVGLRLLRYHCAVRLDSVASPAQVRPPTAASPRCRASCRNSDAKPGAVPICVGIPTVYRAAASFCVGIRTKNDPAGRWWVGSRTPNAGARRSSSEFGRGTSACLVVRRNSDRKRPRPRGRAAHAGERGMRPRLRTAAGGDRTRFDLFS